MLLHSDIRNLLESSDVLPLGNCHFLSLSQAIEAAIELNLKKVEAGAQGEHKIQRGYLPVTTYSCHYILDEGFKKAIEDFLVRETAQVDEFISSIFIWQ